LISTHGGCAEARLSLESGLMAAKILDGSKIAQEIRGEVAA